MEIYVILALLSLLEASRYVRRRMVYFSPTGEWFPAEDWPKVMASTSERGATSEGSYLARERREIKDSRFSELSEEEARAALKKAAAEVKPKGFVYKTVNNSLVLIVYDKEEAKKLIKSFENLGFTNIKLKSKEEKNNELNTARNSFYRKSYKIILKKNKTRK
ncbi:hypothetical protein NBO_13g0051 [Nosema bombycis CQ1]|uniref:Uncharacterized protein n=1 Tax=Nosema bombycis (strain CQ1 / CVCC 102059) TaxID=578461 RepID=R0MAB4_NOSB1|nr:hypothetical protein NBO_13g0051 [Nosema bombycis CQ1]|eukprot:EOB14874.1 hypothetical protein NBO_13g0051 [Nosema bombycis CQ1]